jgi:hypothetical protein
MKRSDWGSNIKQISKSTNQQINNKLKTNFKNRLTRDTKPNYYLFKISNNEKI